MCDVMLKRMYIKASCPMKRDEAMETRQSELMQTLFQELILSPMILRDTDEQETAPRREIALIREAEEGEEVCCICFHRFANTMLLPCTHKDFCRYCAFEVIESSMKCPLCRTHIDNWENLHPIAEDLSDEERRVAYCMEFASYEGRELQVEFVDAFDSTMEAALAYAENCRETVAAWRRGE
jgi:hypothetical protein